ncbi:ammonia-forming cytochrome c nitrite reductase subunit c552 [Paraferrimonas sedimenticola]|uniref:nitrite reductase (cytochrome; ammonia-forming) n=1 Tax=Paraferrimonas sedimenticola TaxID=375674 RepID=A0AA37RVQ8_9GAMM|nr:ammonia-forming cytochrome c nitrite reductase subunit c552 [Paraferrimonas sedimenticola]GLP96151.1 cytochrome c-552 [Paraferrimonas sedimenticola]
MKLQKLAIALAVSAVLAGCSDDDVTEVNCGEGSTLIDNVCVVDPVEPVDPVECGEGTIKDEETNTCVIPPSTGPVDYYNSDNWETINPDVYASWASTANNTPEGGPTDLLEKNPVLVTAWAGYGFAKDYNRARGHHFALTDVIKSLRTGAPVVGHDGEVVGEAMAASCWSCKSTDVSRMYDLVGEARFANQSWSTWGHEMANTIGCADCHELGEDKLRLSRPYTARDLAKVGLTFEEQNHLDQGSQTCAQCHVEYYFDGTDSKKVKYPWDHWVPGEKTNYAAVVEYAGNDGLYEGYSAEAQLAYFDKIGFKDWTNAISGTPNLKTQHPEYENVVDKDSGMHQDFGCVSCHMTKMTNSEDQEYSNHNVRFDLDNVPSDCTGCHTVGGSNDLKTKMADRKAEITEIRFGENGVDARLNEVHFKAQAIWTAKGVKGIDTGATIAEAKANYEAALPSDAEMKNLLTMIRNAQWFWDSATASHGIHAHNFDEAKRLLTKAGTLLDAAIVEADKLLEDHGSTFTYDATNYDSKSKVQPLAGLDLEKMQSDKAEFIEKRVEKEWPHTLK